MKARSVCISRSFTLEQMEWTRKLHPDVLFRCDPTWPEGRRSIFVAEGAPVTDERIEAARRSILEGERIWALGRDGPEQ